MAYRPVDVVQVLAWGEALGAVALDPGNGFYVFEYEPAWRASGIEVAPTTMPLGSTESLFVFPSLPVESFYRLPPMLADALPDAFGNALVDAYLQSEGVAREDITPLDRLAYLGDRGMGALEFRPPRGPRVQRSTAIDLAELVVTARQALSGSFDTDDEINQSLRHLIDVGTSAGGARAKAIIAWNPVTREVRSGQVPADPGFEHWLLKFDGLGEDRDLGNTQDFGRIEFAYHLMATAAGITMMPCQLLAEGGRAHFMTRRFDRRPDGSRVHIQTLCALGELDFRLIGAHDYAQLFQMVRMLGCGPDAVEETFRRMVFNVAAANCDDHTKNFSFLMNLDAEWELTPAYDVTHAHSPTSRWTRQHLMSVNGRSRDITRADLLEVADRFEVPGAKQVVEDVLAAVDEWAEFAAEAGLPKATSAWVGQDIKAMADPLRPSA